MPHTAKITPQQALQRTCGVPSRAMGKTGGGMVGYSAAKKLFRHSQLGHRRT